MSSHLEKQNESRFPVVGIGTSAGGFDALTGLLQHLPPDTGMGFVLVQHLDAEHESAMKRGDLMGDQPLSRSAIRKHPVDRWRLSTPIWVTGGNAAPLPFLEEDFLKRDKVAASAGWPCKRCDGPWCPIPVQARAFSAEGTRKFAASWDPPARN